MKLLEAEPTVAPSALAERAPEAPPEPGPAAARACASCGAAMVPEQDWCLECGTAAPGRLGARPGWRAASTVVGLTLLLVLGAVAASYAALTGDATQVASAPAPPSAAPVAQAPPSVPPAPAPPAPTTPPPAADEGLPSIDPPASTPSDATDPVDATPTNPDPAPITPGTGSSTDDGTSATTDDDDAGDEPAALQALDLGEDAGAAYDPYTKIVAGNDAARAVDGKATTSWFARAAEDADSLGFGYTVALEDPADVRELLLTTRSPGFRVEVYGTTSRALPPDVLDERWIHLRDRSDVDATVGGAPKDGNTSGDGEERITLGDNAEGKRLRHVLLWFTLIPENGPTVRLTEVELRG